jgi:hypothetical protein
VIPADKEETACVREEGANLPGGART